MTYGIQIQPGHSLAMPPTCLQREFYPINMNIRDDRWRIKLTLEPVYIHDNKTDNALPSLLSCHLSAMPLNILRRGICRLIL